MEDLRITNLGAFALTLFVMLNGKMDTNIYMVSNDYEEETIFFGTLSEFMSEAIRPEPVAVPKAFDLYGIIYLRGDDCKLIVEEVDENTERKTPETMDNIDSILAMANDTDELIIENSEDESLYIGSVEEFRYNKTYKLLRSLNIEILKFSIFDRCVNIKIK